MAVHQKPACNLESLALIKATASAWDQTTPEIPSTVLCALTLFAKAATQAAVELLTVVENKVHTQPKMRN